MGLDIIFYPTSKETNQNNILHVYPHHSCSDQGVLMDWGSNGIIASADVRRIDKTYLNAMLTLLELTIIR